MKTHLKNTGSVKYLPFGKYLKKNFRIDNKPLKIISLYRSQECMIDQFLNKI